MADSKIENLLENWLGADNEILPPVSNNERILQNILGVEGVEIGPIQSRIEQLLLDILENGSGGGSGGGSSYRLLASTEIQAQTTSSTEKSLGSISVGEEAYSSNYLIFVKVRNKAGRSSGRFYGSDTIFANPYPAQNQSNQVSTSGYLAYKCGSGNTTTVAMNTKYGVYAASITSDGKINMACKYNSTSSGTVNGTFKVDVYALPWPDDDIPFVVQ